MTDVSVGGMIGLTSLILIFVGFVRDLQGHQYKAALTTLMAWAAGIGAVALYAASQFGHGIVVGGIPLDDMNLASQALVGVTYASTAGLGWTLIKAIDGSQSAAKPELLGGDGPPPPAP